MNEEKSIYHFGILGMKWGHHRKAERVTTVKGKPVIVTGTGIRSKVEHNPSKERIHEVRSNSGVRGLIKKMPLPKAISKIKEFAAKVKVSSDEKKAHNAEVTRRLDAAGKKYDEVYDKNSLSAIKGQQKAKYGMTAAERAAGKAQIKVGQAAIDKAIKEMEAAYKDIPPYKVTAGIAVNRALLAGAAGLIIYNAWQGNG